MAIRKLFAASYDNEYLKWLSILLGLLAMYIPTFYNLSGRLWQSDDHAHAPFVLLITLFLFWQKRTVFISIQDEKSHPIIGCGLFIFGLFVYLLGRSQDILILDVVSLIFIVVGII
jgi:hypothetical protein